MKPIIFTILLCCVQFAFAQQYTFRKLTQEGVTRTKAPVVAPTPKDWGDTSVTVYSGGSIEILHYMLSGDQYDNVFNPPPTGLYLNGQPFNFFCDPDKEYKQSVSMIAEMYEFTYLSRNYLVVFTLRESNTESKYKCYNVFDITDNKKITQVSFPSIHTGEDTFGDFNFDGKIDFVQVISKRPESFRKKIEGNTYFITAYAMENGVAGQLLNKDEEPHYIFAKGDENVENFTVLQHDWMIPLKDSSGVQLTKNNAYDKYEPFDPKNAALFTKNGVKVEKKKYSVFVGAFDDDGGANEISSEIQSKKLGNGGHGYDIFIMMDQYGPAGIKWMVLVGNYMTKAQAQKAAETLKQHGFHAEVKDLKASY